MQTSLITQKDNDNRDDADDVDNDDGKYDVDNENVNDDGDKNNDIKKKTFKNALLPVHVSFELVTLVFELEDHFAPGEHNRDDSLLSLLVEQRQHALLPPWLSGHPHRHEQRELVREVATAREQLVRPEVDVAGISRELEGVHVTVGIVQDADARGQLLKRGHSHFEQVHGFEI